MRVWTRQHIKVLEKINRDGRYVATPDIISLDMPEHKNIMMEVYSWLANNMPIIMFSVIKALKSENK